MTDSLLLESFALGILFVAIGVVLGAARARRGERASLVAAVALPLASACLFHSLAIHMYQRLGGWPERIGDHGFPQGLITHADLAQLAFGSMLLGCLVWPLAFLLCAGVPRLRPGLRALGTYAVASVLSFGATFLAPGPFRDWWWD